MIFFPIKGVLSYSAINLFLLSPPSPQFPKGIFCQKKSILVLKLCFLSFFHTFWPFLGSIFGLLAPYGAILTLFNAKPPFLALLGKAFPGKVLRTFCQSLKLSTTATMVGGPKIFWEDQRVRDLKKGRSGQNLR